VFFGEQLPDRFLQLHAQDLKQCDLLIVLGTSLVVAPFNSLVTLCNPKAPRLLINREMAGQCEQLGYGFRFHRKEDGQLRQLAERGIHPMQVLPPHMHQEKPLKRILKIFDVEGIAHHIASSGCTRIVVMCGAGISTSAGIPDFRSPGTGLYDNLQKYNLPQPEAVFSLDYFRQRPNAFYELAKEMWPGNWEPKRSVGVKISRHSSSPAARPVSRGRRGLTSDGFSK